MPQLRSQVLGCFRPIVYRLTLIPQFPNLAFARPSRAAVWHIVSAGFVLQDVERLGWGWWCQFCFPLSPNLQFGHASPPNPFRELLN